MRTVIPAERATPPTESGSGTRWCAIDDHVTRICGHHYQKIACLVQRHTSASVVAAHPLQTGGPGDARCCCGRWPPTSSADHGW